MQLIGLMGPGALPLTALRGSFAALVRGLQTCNLSLIGPDALSLTALNSSYAAKGQGAMGQLTGA